MGTGDQARPSPETCPDGSHRLGALAAGTDRSSTRDTAVLEGALRCGVCPTSLTAECFHTATGWAEHCDLDGLAFCLESGGDVEQVLSGAGHVVGFVCGYCTGSGSDIRRAVPMRHPSQYPPTRQHRHAPSGWVRHQGSLARSSCRP